MHGSHGQTTCQYFKELSAVRTDSFQKCRDVLGELERQQHLVKKERDACCEILDRLDLCILEIPYLNEFTVRQIQHAVYPAKKAIDLRLLWAVELKLCKILLDSRAFVKTEMEAMLHKVIACCVPASNQAMVTRLVNNEAFHYVEPRHRTSFLDTMWHLGEAIQQHRYVDVAYGRLKDRKIVKRRLKPLALLFSEYYFYLIAFIDDKDIAKIYESARDITPTIYRLDRIKTLEVEQETFHIPYNRRFQEGEFRKRVQFMYGGRLQRVTFTYTGYDIDAILDRLPTAKILSEDNGTYQLEAEVYGKGIEMWLRSQGKNVKDVKIVEL